MCFADFASKNKCLLVDVCERCALSVADFTSKNKCLLVDVSDRCALSDTAVGRPWF